MKKKTFTITSIIDWMRDDAHIAGDKSHVNPRDVDELINEEIERKIDNDEWPGLPFTCEAANEDEAIDIYNGTCCAFDYIIAITGEYETNEE